MTSLPQLHDGFFDGVWLSSEKGTRLFVRTEAGERSTIILSGVEALNISGVRAGNIIFDLVLVPSDKLTLKHIEDTYALEGGEGEMSRHLLSQAQERGLSGLEIRSSYGAEGSALFRALEIVREHLL